MIVDFPSNRIERFENFTPIERLGQKLLGTGAHSPQDRIGRPGWRSHDQADVAKSQLDLFGHIERALRVEIDVHDRDHRPGSAFKRVKSLAIGVDLGVD